MALRHRRITSCAKYRKSLGLSAIEFIGHDPTHTVRSLRCVGGDRPRSTHSMRRLNRFARQRGHRNWSDYVAELAANRKLMENLQSIGSTLQAA